jgi:hypothetical protein
MHNIRFCDHPDVAQVCLEVYPPSSALRRIKHLVFSLRVAAGKKERHGPCVRNITQSGTIQIKEAGHNRLLDFHCQIMIH